MLITGPGEAKLADLAKSLEAHLFNCGRWVYYLGFSSSLSGLDADLKSMDLDRTEYLRRLGETAHMFTDAGAIFVSTIAELDDHELDMLKTLSSPGEFVVVNIGASRFSQHQPDLQIDAVTESTLREVHDLLRERNHVIEYYL